MALRNLLEICKRSVQNMRALSSFQPCQMGIQTMGGKIPEHCFSAVVLNLKQIQVLLDVLLLTETKLGVSNGWASFSLLKPSSLINGQCGNLPCLQLEFL